MESPWIRDIRTETQRVYNVNKFITKKVTRMYIRLDTQYTVPLNEIPTNLKENENNIASIFLKDTNQIIFNFNREIRNVKRVEVTRMSTPKNMLPMKYFLPDIKDSVTDNYYVGNQLINKAGDAPFELSPLSYLASYSGNGLATYGVTSKFKVPTSNTVLNFSQGDLMVGQTSGATGKFLYFSDSLHYNLNFIPTWSSGEWPQFQCGENIDVTYSSNGITNVVKMIEETWLNEDDCTRIYIGAFVENGIMYVPKQTPTDAKGSVYNPPNVNGRINGINRDQYVDTYDQKNAASSWVMPDGGSSHTKVVFSLGGIIPTDGDYQNTTGAAGKTWGDRNWYKINDRVGIVRSGNSIIDGVHTISNQATGEYAGAMELDITTSVAQAQRKANPVALKIVGQFWDQEKAVDGAKFLWDRILLDSKDTKIVFAFPELGSFYSPLVNIKNYQKNSVPTYVTCEISNFIDGNFTTYNNYESQDFIFFRNYSTPINLQKLTMQCFTSEQEPLILSDVLWGEYNQNVVIDITLFIEEYEDIRLSSQISSVPYANIN